MVRPIIDGIIVILDSEHWYCGECKEVSEAKYAKCKTKRCDCCGEIMQRDEVIETLKEVESQEQDEGTSSALNW